MATGSIVRRAGWLTRSIFLTRGCLYWLNAPDGTQRVITATDFQRGEFLALDWTDSAANQGHCVGLVVTAEMVAVPATLSSGGTSVVTLTISLAQADDLTFALSSDTTLTVPSTVTIPAGSLAVSFNAAAGTLIASGNASLGATSPLCACTATIALQYVVPPPPPPQQTVFAFSGHKKSGLSGPIARTGSPPPLVVGDPFSFQNPWGAPCTVVISGTINMVLVKELKAPNGSPADQLYHSLPLSYTMTAGQTDTFHVNGSPFSMDYSLAVTLSL